MALTDCFKVDVRLDLAGQEAHNVFFYRGVAGIDVFPQDIADSWAALFEALYIQLMPDEYVLQDVSVINLFTSDAEGVVTLNSPGEVDLADLLPTFNAINFTLSPGTRVTRPGSKRIFPPYEAVQSNGIVNSAPYIVLLNDLADAFGDSLENVLATNDIADPVIVKRILDGTNYRLPETVGEFVANPIVGVLIDLVISSQLSRKIGTGD